MIVHGSLRGSVTVIWIFYERKFKIRTYSREARFARHSLVIRQNTAKYCMYLYYNFVYLVHERTHILHTSGSLALLGSLSASEDDLYSEKTNFCALRAGGAREAGFFFISPELKKVVIRWFKL